MTGWMLLLTDKRGERKTAFFAGSFERLSDATLHVRRRTGRPRIEWRLCHRHGDRWLEVDTTEGRWCLYPVKIGRTALP